MQRVQRITRGLAFSPPQLPFMLFQAPPAPSLCCECQSPHSRGFAAPGPSPDSGRHRRLYFVASSEVINGARRSFVYLYRAEFPCGGCGGVGGSRWLETVRLSNTRSDVKQALLLRSSTARGGGGVSQGQFPPSLLFS